MLDIEGFTYLNRLVLIVSFIHIEIQIHRYICIYIERGVCITFFLSCFSAPVGSFVCLLFLYPF